MKSKIDFSKVPDKEKGKWLLDNHLEKQKTEAYEAALHKHLGLTYRYFRFYAKGKEVSVSVGYRLIKDSIEYAIALQSKNDNFSRKEARKVINTRYARLATGFMPLAYATKEIDILIATHYNGDEVPPHGYGVKMIPEYLRRIPISVW